MEVLGYFNGQNVLKNGDKRLEKILESDPRLESFGQHLSEKSDQAKKSYESSKRTVEAAKSIKESIDKQKDYSNKTLEIIDQK